MTGENTTELNVIDTQASQSIPKEPPFRFWDNPDNIMTLEQYQLTETIIQCGVKPILFFVGVPTNLLSCVIFYKQGLRDRMNLCLFVLGLVDTLHLLSSLIIGFYAIISLWDEAFGREYFAKLLVSFFFVLVSMRVVSGLITMVVAVERCVCVVLPLRANSIMRTRSMGALLAAIIITIISGFSIICVRNKVVAIYDETGEVHYEIAVTDYFKKHPLVFDIIHEIILSFTIPLVTFVVVGVATAITVIKLRTAMAWRASTSSGRADNHGQQQQAALTKMLVILSCVFMSCSAPLASLSVVRLLVPDYSVFGRYSNFYYASTSVAVEIGLVNSSINFFVYYFRSSKFRHDFLVLVGRKKAEDRKQTESSDTKVTSVGEF